MSEVTREDVAQVVREALVKYARIADDPEFGGGPEDVVSHALIAAFPHLVGSIESMIEFGNRPAGGYRTTPAERERHVVHSPWREVER